MVVGRRGRRRSRAEVEALVAEYEASGVTRKAFCAGRGLSEATLDLYRKRLEVQLSGSPGPWTYLFP